MATYKTIQDNIKSMSDEDISSLMNYSLFLGGTNAINDALRIYDPLVTGYGRIFMVRKPYFLDQTMPNKMKAFKHILEYGNTSIQGINDVTMQFNTFQGGYAGRAIEVPSFAQDDTNSFSITVYEFSGSPVREVIHSWINGTSDLLSGLTHYNGYNPAGGAKLSNQTAEFIYVSTDRTGNKVEYACMFANCFPKNIKNDQFNYNSGEHNLVEYQIEFSCIKYESRNINKLAKSLIANFKVLGNSLNFYSGYNANDDIVSKVSDTAGNTNGTSYDSRTGKLKANTTLKTV